MIMTAQKRLLGAYAHPDDEQGVSGLMRKYANAGAEVTLVCATRGEAGEIAPGVNATMENLGQVREDELRCAAEKIGIRNLYFLDYRDSGMIGTPENNDPRALWQANLFEVAEKLTRLIRRHQPQVMLTFDPNGGYGHPDHIRIHEAALIAYFVSGDARAYPEHIAREGLQPWSASKLYWGAFPRKRFEKYAQLAKLAGLELNVPLQEFLKRATPDEAITTQIDVAEFVDLKLSALACHASQMNPNRIWDKIPQDIRRAGLAVETLIRAESRVVVPPGMETDVFAGIE
jgi:LmbE family N-acetylglucosaminyl deacetylase